MKRDPDPRRTGPLACCLALIFGLWATALPAFDVIVITDDSITFLDPVDAGQDAGFPFAVNAQGQRAHRITLDNPLTYRQCRADYRAAKTVRVRWVPQDGFSDFADDHYDIILSIITPSDPERDEVTIQLRPPEGFTRALLDQYEKPNPGDGLVSVEAFFTTALLAKHFAHALPEGSAKTRRMVNASVDHLLEANKLFGSPNVQPGWEYERFVTQYAGDDSRAALTVKALKGMNVAFFRDIRVAYRNVLDGDAAACDRGLTILRELSQCYDDISAQDPALLPDVASVVNSNDPQLAGATGFDFAARLRDAEAICRTRHEN